jgi:transcriptional regulator with XRE-family HTH domain
VDAAEVVRALRRRCGCSQRTLAALSGVPLSTIAAIESGSRQPSVRTLDRLLAAGGLDLEMVERRLDEPAAALVNHLQRSTSQRLWEALGGHGRVRPGPALPVFEVLASLARSHLVVLTGPAALGVWLPGRRAAQPLPVHVEPRDLAVGPRVAMGGLLEAQEGIPDVAVATVGVAVDVAIGVATPWALRLDRACAHERNELRDVARLLHDGGARADAGRRVPAHRDPREPREFWSLYHRKVISFGSRAAPSVLDSRSWRLDEAASLAQWLRERGVAL